MASRRDELNAYAFAKRRLVAQFLRPSPSGSEEGAPRPLRAVLPGLLAGVVVLAGFGVWGMFRPVAPKDWDEPYGHVIVASGSTTRYVVLTTKGEHRLHPVLNMASARLLVDVDDNRSQVIKVDDAVLDNGELPRGATVGIPYAPDRVPDAAEVAKPKLWAACERAEQGGRAVQTAVFVLTAHDGARLDETYRLRGGQLLYVESAAAGHQRYVVDAEGTKYPISSANSVLLAQVAGVGRVPQRVSQEWLATLHEGNEIVSPVLPEKPGGLSRVPGLPVAGKRVGSVLRVAGDTYFLVLRDRAARVSPFTASLLLNSRPAAAAGLPAGPVDTGITFPPGAWFRPYAKWPEHSPGPRSVNSPHPAKGHRNTVCNVLRSVHGSHGTTTLSTWAGPEFPRPLATGAGSAYVTPGSGQYFRQISGTQTGAGPYFLVTDAGLRHSLQAGTHSAPGDAAHRDGPYPTGPVDTGSAATGSTRTDSAGTGSADAEGGTQREARQPLKTARELLGYERVEAAPIPSVWSSLLPTGPRLSTGAAVQLQGP
ncbi:type VII secretion protein EccB [Streptomyces sp. NPDC058657]|uniref:type VII secretion protein EccB n=1 Tax=unclassified Streptomyces TaxID=2593676 RepID=UPI00365EA0F9